MALETGTYISDLVATNPEAGDNVTAGDDHIRLLKAALLASFPGVTGAVTATHTELNLLDGVTATTAELNILDGVKATTSELNVLDGVTATTAEINYLSGVTSAIQTQINAIGTGVAGNWVLLKTNTISLAVATSTFVNGSAGVVIDSTYDEYMFVLTNIRPTSDATLYLRTSTDAGSNYDSGATDYHTAIDGAAASTAAQIALTGAVDAGTAYGASGTILVFSPAATGYTKIISEMVYTNTSIAPVATRTVGWRQAVADVDAFQFLFSAGNIRSDNSPTIRLYGRKKS